MSRGIGLAVADIKNQSAQGSSVYTHPGVDNGQFAFALVASNHSASISFMCKACDCVNNTDGDPKCTEYEIAKLLNVVNLIKANSGTVPLEKLRKLFVADSMPLR